MKTLLMENRGIATRQTIDFVTSIDTNYKEYNTQDRDYMRSNDLWIFGMLIQPELENIVTSSAFEHGMPFYAYESFGKEFEGGSNKCGFKQIEYYAWLFYEAVGFRKRAGMKPLSIHINYLYPDFLKHLKTLELGKNTTMYIKLMLHQSEGHVILYIYDEYQLVSILKTEDDLLLTK